jgi:hypothetical protein
MPPALVLLLLLLLRFLRRFFVAAKSVYLPLRKRLVDRPRALFVLNAPWSADTLACVLARLVAVRRRVGARRRHGAWRLTSDQMGCLEVLL